MIAMKNLDTAYVRNRLQMKAANAQKRGIYFSLHWLSMYNMMRAERCYYTGFSVDAGLIGCVHADLIEEGSTFRDAPECGRLVEFKEPFTVQAYSNGDIRIGNITVETGDNYEEEDEDFGDFEYGYDED